jgi:hypothetical protein
MFVTMFCLCVVSMLMLWIYTAQVLKYVTIMRRLLILKLRAHIHMSEDDAEEVDNMILLATTIDGGTTNRTIVLDEDSMCAAIQTVCRMQGEAQWAHFSHTLGKMLGVSPKILCGHMCMYYCYTLQKKTYVKVFLKDDKTVNTIRIPVHSTNHTDRKSMLYIDKPHKVSTVEPDDNGSECVTIMDCIEWFNMFAGPDYNFHNDSISVQTFLDFCHIMDSSISPSHFSAKMIITRRSGNSCILTTTNSLHDYT